MDFLKDPDENIAVTAVSTLGDLHLRPDLCIPALTDALQDGRERVEREAMTVLGKFGPEAQAIVMELLSDPRTQIRTSAILATAQFGTKVLPVIPRLIAFLKDPEKSEPAISPFALVELQLRPDLSVPALTNLLQYGSSEIGLVAHTALSKFGLVFPAAPGPGNVMDRYGNSYGLGPGIRRSQTNAAQRLAD